MKYVGLALLIIGLGLMGFSYYVTYRVNKRTEKVHRINEHMDRNPLLELGGPLTEGPAEEIGYDADKEVARKEIPYVKLATYTHMLGIILSALGVAIALFLIVRKIVRSYF